MMEWEIMSTPYLVNLANYLSHTLDELPSRKITREFLVVQWLGLRALTAKCPGSISGWGTKISQAVQCNL